MNQKSNHHEDKIAKENLNSTKTIGSKNVKKFHFARDVEEEYLKFCYELVDREERGEKIDWKKEVANFWKQKMKVMFKNDEKSISDEILLNF